MEEHKNREKHLWAEHGKVSYNDLVDQLYLGLLLRTLYNPRKFFLRTLKSLSLIKQFFQK